MVPPGAMMMAPHMGLMAPKCTRAVYIILGVFLGLFGVHNFVAGRTDKAVPQLLITLLTGWLIIPLLAVKIWVIIEVCTVTTDGNGTPMN